ncbi:LOW QUALITY PROTEIN: B3 domain-containing protein REM16-like [Lycium barbarum]|uniref:LOW QUALITY PROTEIN: B3 domain-containing protein REM16-like n=1 Tax=Lycium barbarum TaxID=112863 RepID=UPI00293E27BB|nr:LOW QUALITY PROTEIN: B3 domain-containing protein REM16-like [Lycium barbarum]
MMKLQAIPPKFANNLREKLAGSVSLKGPSGATWNVGLTANGDTLFLKHGWKEFIDAHSLEEDDLLIFKYNGDSRFDVLMFDKQSSCEKQASYFVKKCDHTDVASQGRTKKPVTESNDATDESSHDVFEATATTKHSKHALTPTSSARGTRANVNLRSREIKSTSSRTGGYTLELTTNRRAINDEEKQKAFDLATAAVTPNSFLVVMRPSHVYKGFYKIPSEWARVHLPRRNLDVMLRIKEKTWQAKFQNTDYGGGLTGGWRRFVLENFLEEFDVCVFNLTCGEDGATILDVNIFRVVEEVTPPSRVTPASSSKVRKPNKFARKKAQ